VFSIHLQICNLISLAMKLTFSVTTICTALSRAIGLAGAAMQWILPRIRGFGGDYSRMHSSGKRGGIWLISKQSEVVIFGIRLNSDRLIFSGRYRFSPIPT
jgi:hypothetical protein